MTEAQNKRDRALAAAFDAGFEALVASTPATVRWLLCGRGQPVDVCSTDYVVVLLPDRAYVLHKDIETPRVETEERLTELGFERITFPWHAGPGPTIGELLAGARPGSDSSLEPVLAAHRRTLGPAECERYRAAGRAAAEAMSAALATLDPAQSELHAADELAGHAEEQGLVPRVVLVAGEEHLPLYRHPVPTHAPLGRCALLALTAEREGLFVSLTRLASFGAPAQDWSRIVRATAEIDATVLAASRPGASLGELFEVLATTYEEHGFPEEWRHHHQGGLTGYKGREVFATPGDETLLPTSCAVAWNPSITGGGKSEDTALVGPDGVEILTSTPALPLLDTAPIARPGITVL